MLTATAAFRNAAIAANRRPIQKVEVAWEREIDPGIGFFTLDVSTLDGTDVLKADDSDIADINLYLRTDESSRVLSLEIERLIDQPVFSASTAVCDVVLDNSDDRYTPGAGSSIEDFILVNRPFYISMGFNYGTAEYLFKFVGVNRELPRLDKKNKTATFQVYDLGSTVWSTPIEKTEIFINESVSDIIAALFESAGLLPDQIDVDPSEQKIDFAHFEVGTLLGEAISKLAQVDLGMAFFNENGIATYRTRDWFQRTSIGSSTFGITDSIVLAESAMDTAHIVNSVEIKATPRTLQDYQPVYILGSAIEIAPGETVDFFTEYKDPVVNVITPAGGAVDTSYFYANTSPTNDGIEYTSNVEVLAIDNFAMASKISFRNNGARYAYVTDMQVYGQPARALDESITIKEVDQDSIDDNGEYVLQIENNFIQSASRAKNMALVLLQDLKNPGNYRELTVIAQPQLQLGDKITRDGSFYNVIKIRERLTPTEGMVQDLVLINRTLTTYFRLDISRLDGADTLAF